MAGLQQVLEINFMDSNCVQRFVRGRERAWAPWKHTGLGQQVRLLGLSCVYHHCLAPGVRRRVLFPEVEKEPLLLGHRQVSQVAHA